VYTKPVSGWTTTNAPAAKLTAAAGADNDNLGLVVAISNDGNTVVAAAPNNAVGGTWHGAAYVFTKGANWADNSVPTATLTTAAGVNGNLGYAVAISSDGGSVVAGAPNNDTGGSNRGVVYVFTRADSSSYTIMLPLVVIP
jgi:hypothetical protein